MNHAQNDKFLLLCDYSCFFFFLGHCCLIMLLVVIIFFGMFGSPKYIIVHFDVLLALSCYFYDPSSGLVLSFLPNSFGPSHLCHWFHNHVKFSYLSRINSGCLCLQQDSFNWSYAQIFGWLSYPTVFSNYIINDPAIKVLLTVKHVAIS